MPSFTSIDEVVNYLFDWSLQDDEGELHIALVLLSHMTWYMKKGLRYRWLLLTLEKRDHIIFNILCPKWWGVQKTYIYLFLFFLKNDIKPEVDFHKDIFLQFNKLSPEYNLDNEYFDRFYNKGEADLIFQDTYFFQLWPEILEYIEIKNTFDTEENIEKIESIIDEHIDNFVSGRFSEKHKLLPYEEQRNKIFNKLSDYYSLVWDSFVIWESRLSQYEKISIIYTIVLLWKLEYISISDFSVLEDTHEKEDPSFTIRVTHKSEKLFKWLFKMKNLLLDKIFDEEYKKISITKKWGELHMLEWEKEYDSDGVRFVELQKKYPNSEIKAKNYKGKVTKYEVKEKIRLLDA